MATLWKTPQIISQYAETGAEAVHIQWDGTNNFNEMKRVNGQSVGLLGNLEHTSRSPKTDITNKTYFLKCTGFNFENIPGLISGIELKLTMQRFGRITDDTIQLCYNNNPIGDNLANLDINLIKTYGNQNNLWSINELTSQMVSDSSFGVILRFRSHPKFPHRNGVFIDAVELRIH